MARRTCRTSVPSEMSPTDEDLARAAETIRAGGLVAFPTETVYGLGADALNPEAVAKIYEAKGRPWASPIIVHVADENMARAITAEWPPLARQLAERFWPGPLTIIIRKAPQIADVVTAGLDAVGVRVPAHPIALRLIQTAGVPIAAPSANHFGGVSPTTAEHVRRGLGSRVNVILDGGPTQIGIESTVVSLRRSAPTVLRPGMISQAELETVTGRVWDRELNQPVLQESPGQNVRHYAPRTPLYLIEPGSQPPPGEGLILEMPDDPRGFANQLYAELHRADTQNWAWIAIKKPPETAQWEGILDRLQRASARH